MSTDTNEPGTLTFNAIRCHALPDLGQFRTIKNKFGWKARKWATGVHPPKTVQLDAIDLDRLCWICSNVKDYQLKAIMKNGEIYRFDGFRESNYDALAKHALEYWKHSINTENVFSKGWNWGLGHVTDKSFQLSNDGDVLLELTSNYINHINISKTDVNMILKPDNDRMDTEDQMTEIRFYLPAQKTEENEATNEDFKTKLLNISKAKGFKPSLSISTFNDLKVLLPAGRFNLEIYSDTLRLVGKSNDFGISFKDLSALYHLPSYASPHLNFIISLSSPIHRGHTSYPNLIIQFDSDQEIQLDEAPTDPALIAALSSIKEEPTESEAVKLESDTVDQSKENDEKKDFRRVKSYDLASTLISQLSSMKILQPGAFRSSSGQCCFRTSFKADSGTFYLLEKSFVFIPKPVHIVNYSDILNFSFARTQGSRTKLFEFFVNLKGGIMLGFSSVDRQEAGPLMEFLKMKQIPVRSFDEQNEERLKAALGDMSDDQSDENYEENDDDEDDDDDDDDDEDDNENSNSDDEDKADSREGSDTGE